MALYGLFLAGSNYLAPVICGFIAEYQGWRWVFYWPSIFTGVALIFLFFCMEETNYVREHVEPSPMDSFHNSHSEDHEKSAAMSNHPITEAGAVYTKKTYRQKLSLLGPHQTQNTMFRRFWQSLYYLSWPVIFYAGYASLISVLGTSNLSTPGFHMDHMRSFSIS